MIGWASVSCSSIGGALLSWSLELLEKGPQVSICRVKLNRRLPSQDVVAQSRGSIKVSGIKGEEQFICRAPKEDNDQFIRPAAKDEEFSSNCSRPGMCTCNRRGRL